jgi:hypothetical protein
MIAKRRKGSPRRRPQPVTTTSTRANSSHATTAPPNAADEATNFYASLLSKSASTPFLISHSEDAKITNLIKLIANDVLEHVRPRFERDPIGELLRPERLVVTTMPHATVQAATVWMSSTHAIAVNRGLMLFMYRLARAVSPHIISRGQDDPPAPPESQAISIIASLIDFMSSPVRAPLVPDWPAAPREVKTAENLTTAGERFVISHEIAHIMCRHLIADARDVDPATTTAEDLDHRPMDQEIEADTIGAAISIDSHPNPRAGAVGIVMFLHTVRLAESVGAIVPDGKHPSAIERLETLWDVLPRRYGAQFAAVTSWADELSALLTRLSDAALRERQGRRRRARRTMTTIFRDHPSQIVRRNAAADRTLIADVQRLYDIAPGAVIEAVAGNLLDAPQLQRITSSTSDQFRRHRLALFIAHHCMAAPVRAALGMSL